MKGVGILACCTLLLASPVRAQDAELIEIPELLEGLPFSAVARVGNLLYLSGQIGTIPGTKQLVEGGIAAETRQTMENIRFVLEHVGSSLERIVKCTIFLADISDYAPMNVVYASYFERPYPARSTMAGSGLALGARVEIECIATVANEG